MATGRLLVFEGPEGAGKSTQIRRLEEYLRARGARFLCVREPGGTALGNQIRRLLLDPYTEMTPRAEALLFMASRAELVERHIRPALAEGRLVIADRFFLSTYAYQVGGRRLPEADVRAANGFATGRLVPDLTVLLDLPWEEGLARAGRRSDADRMERAGVDFHERVAAAFASFVSPAWQQAHPECGPILAVDARGSEDEVFERVLAGLNAQWPETFPAERVFD